MEPFKDNVVPQNPVLVPTMHYNCILCLSCQVDSIELGEGSSDYQIVRVVQQAVLQPYGYEGKEIHHLPLVPEIITGVYPQGKLMTASPPAGKRLDIQLRPATAVKIVLPQL